MKDGRPAACSPEDPTVVYSDTFGLGWRFGISYDSQEWFAPVRSYLDHNHSHTEKDEASITICLKDSDNNDAQQFKERKTTISNFGHGQPALLGTWAPAHLIAHPYVSLTVVTQAKFPRVVADPLDGTALALRQSMEGGDVVDTKFYAFSTKRPGVSAATPRVVYGNSSSLRLTPPEPTSGGKPKSGTVESLFDNLKNEINRDSVLHAYEYEQDSDLDEDEDENERLPSQPSASTAARPIQGGPSHDDTDGLSAEPPAYSLGDERLQELAFRAIKEGLSKDNIVEEAFTWFTARYPDIIKFEVDKISEFRKLPEVSLALRLQLKSVSFGEKPWAHDVLAAIMEMLNHAETAD
ncbi:hypothetical protein BS17DRAFT_764561 [Gyrodon lividus]|nr:hypothetical protein BS17DRAFT_764561 [Gyrodon lividus]